MFTGDRSAQFSLNKKHVLACGVLGGLLAIIVGSLFLQHRQREWLLRQEQAQHRLNIAFELISREAKRVRADAMYLANRDAVRQFVFGNQGSQEELTSDLIQFIQRKEFYDQIRLLDMTGRETLRINYGISNPRGVMEPELQDKSDRYYFQEALRLKPDEMFVSEFDLNLEHGKIEKPLKPVIRFVTPVTDGKGSVNGFLVLNYLGAAMLRDLQEPTIPGSTLLLRHDGHYIRGPNDDDAWGWLLGHDRSFAKQFPYEWSRRGTLSNCELTANGVFATSSIQLGRIVVPVNSDIDPSSDTAAHKNSIMVVSYLPQSEVFTATTELLQRLFLFAAVVFTLGVFLTRAWARATVTRELQATRIAASEERLRELSSRLLQIQEDERRQISREIHDDLGQQVTAINLDLKLAERNFEAGTGIGHLQRAIQENEALLSALHEFAKRVRPAVLDDLGLQDAIESLLQDFQMRLGIHLDTRLRFDPGKIPENVADNVFRLIQESLTNVAKHADATKVTVEIDTIDNDGELLISVCDDGRGHSVAKSRDRLGLIGMQERVDLLNGQLDLESSVNEGTRISIRLPLTNNPLEMQHATESHNRRVS